MLRLSQVTGGHLTDDEGDCNAVSTAKLDVLSDILDTMLTEDRKLVIMARFVPELNEIQKTAGTKNRSAMRLCVVVFLTVQRKSGDFRKMQTAVYLLGRLQRQD